MLHSSTREVSDDDNPSPSVEQHELTDSQILYAYEDENGEDVIASLDFWSKAQQA